MLNFVSVIKIICGLFLSITSLNKSFLFLKESKLVYKHLKLHLFSIFTVEDLEPVTPDSHPPPPPLTFLLQTSCQ